jgi:hypothetical protein
MLKFPAIIVLAPISTFRVNICFMYLGASMLGAYIFKIHIYSLADLAPLSLYNAFSYSFDLKSIPYTFHIILSPIYTSIFSLMMKHFK